MTRFKGTPSLRTLAFALVATALTSSGCAALFPSIEKDPDFPKYFTKRASGNTEQARLETDRLYGSVLELKKEGDSYRGHTSIGIIDLRTGEGGKIEGSVANMRTELYVQEAPPVLSVRGNYAGKLSEFDYGPGKFVGTIGDCQYDLTRAKDTGVWYTGQSVCNLQARRTDLAFPADLESLPPTERALYIVTFLGR